MQVDYSKQTLSDSDWKVYFMSFKCSSINCLL